MIFLNEGDSGKIIHLLHDQILTFDRTLFQTAGLVLDTAQSTAETEVQKMGEEVSWLYRNRIGQGLSSEALHRTIAQASIYSGPTDRETSQNTTQRSYRSL